MCCNGLHLWYAMEVVKEQQSNLLLTSSIGWKNKTSWWIFSICKDGIHKRSVHATASCDAVGCYGKTFTLWLILKIFIFYYFLRTKLFIENDQANVALVRPVGLCRYDQHGEHPIAPIVQNLEVENIVTKIEHNLQRLNLEILDVVIDDFHVCYQRNSTGVHGPIIHFLQHIACVVVCYHDHHHV